MAVTMNGNRSDSHSPEPRAARRREMVEGLLLLAVLVVLAIVSRLPAG